MRAVSLSTFLLLWAVALHGQSSYSQTGHTQKETKLTWGPAPAVFPAGAKMAVVSGDPGKADMFTIQLSMPDGYRIPPHFHPTDEDVKVMKGTLLVGKGDTLDLSKANAIKAGGTGKVPATMHHYAAAEGATQISVTAMGPFALTYVNPADDPQRAAHQ
jgi:quercetin dioxygenase-like cupin family protein